MKITKFLTAALFFAGTVFQANASDIPRGEYPRPQFERSAWMNLNGVWDYTFDFSASGLERGLEKATSFEGRITVPFCPESSLSGVGYTDFINCIWYHREVAVPEAWSGKDILLNFGAVYYNAEVYVDGVFAARHIGGSSSFSVDLTRLVTPGKSHHLVVRATSDVRSTTQGAGKQNLQYASYSCNYTRTTGIWQTVWMEAVNEFGLERVQVMTDIDRKQLTVIPTYYGSANGNSLSVTVKDGDKIVARAESTAAQGMPLTVPIKNPKLWSPEAPFLYDVIYEVKSASGEVLDRVESYAGMRKIHIDGNKIYLNNKPYYQRLVLDQGFYPDGVWTAPSDEALRRDIEMSKEAGFNGARLHQKVFEERFHYWADKLGYLVWGEMASWDKNYNLVGAARNFLSEWSNIVVRDRNHPALVVWTPFNEEWGTPSNEAGRFMTDVYDETRRLDPSRPVNTVSGGLYVISDFCTAHNYEQDGEKLHRILFDGENFYQPQGPDRGFDRAILKLRYDGRVPYILDEFGGIKCAETQPEGGNSWGYGDAAPTREDFYKRLEAQVKAIVDHSDKICGFCYTQLTDVEQEQNGVYYYDRGSKFDMKRVSDIFRMKAEGYEQ